MERVYRKPWGRSVPACPIDASGNRIAARDAIQRLLSRDPEQLRLAAIGARRTHIFTPAQHFQRLFSLYQNATPPILTPSYAPDYAPGATAAAA
jgi:hypothetical protein